MKKYLTAFDMCLHMFISIPLPTGKWDDGLRRLSTACLPLVGLIVGLLWFVVAKLSRLLLPDMLSAALTAAFPFLITGFIHLDGYMDTSDAILSWRDRDEKLKILKDVHVGSFAVVMIALLMLFQFAACMSAKRLFPLMLIPVLSRCCSGFCVLRLKMLGHSEYAGEEQTKSDHAVDFVLLMGLLALAALLSFSTWKGLIVGVVTVVAYVLAMARCIHVFGGVSGDLAGFSLTVSELFGLIALAIVG